MGWEAIAGDLLAAAEGADLTSPVARSVVAPGPLVARDCRMLAVWLDSIEAATAPGLTDLPGSGSCSVVPVINLRLLFVADCAPVPTDNGTPPPADKVTEWAELYLADVEAVWNAAADAAADGTLGECSSVTLGQSVHTGPSGGIATTLLPLRIAPL